MVPASSAPDEHGRAGRLWVTTQTKAIVERFSRTLLVRWSYARPKYGAARPHPLWMVPAVGAGRHSDQVVDVATFANPKGRAMATFTVWKFSDADAADRAVATLGNLQSEQLITVQDSAVVSWAAGAKKPKTRQLHNLGVGGALGGAFWGLLFGMLFFVPLLGMAIGAATGGLAGSLTDVGIDDDFINRVKQSVTPGTSALFLLSSDAVIDKVRAEFEGFDAELIHTNLSDEQEQALREAFEEE
jgi:uncharacterized membrane protein